VHYHNPLTIRIPKQLLSATLVNVTKN